MINTKQLVRRIRYKVNDNDETAYSDYDIINALNEALSYIGQSQSLVNSDFMEKTRVYDEAIYATPMFSCFGYSLPDDFATLVSVTRKDGYKLHPTEASNIPSETEYKITGDKIFSGSKCFMLVYKKILDPITDFDEDIDLPVFCAELIVKTAVMILTQAETDVMMKAIDDTARSIIPRRRYAGAQMNMPFKV